jgi:Fe-S cluster biogenesis protein NfuA/nitrite reductase/ring-hydroxylating ferredoxin subunit
MDKDFQKGIERIEAQIQQIESIADPNLRANAVELVQSLINLHGVGIERLLEIVARSPNGQAVIDQLGDDDLVGNLLILHNLHPLDLETRVKKALSKVGPYLASHGGSVELIKISETGVVQLQLQGSCKTCPSSTMTLKLAIEDAIHQAAPDVTAIEAEGVTAESKTNVVQISRPTGNGQNKTSWEEVSDLQSLEPSSLRALDVRGRSVLFCRLGENLYAYGNNCPACGQTLHEAQLEQTALICPTCSAQFDVIGAGRAIDQIDLHLEPFPLLVEKGLTKVALPPLKTSLAPAHYKF